MHAVSRRNSSVVGLVAAAGLAMSGLAAVPANAGAGPSISINDPARAGQPVAGRVELNGNVSKASSDTTTVLYVVDATGSTKDLALTDCNGDGAVGAGDDVNADGVVGDVLDCEIGAVRSLNASLSASHPDDMVVGVEAFANLAKVAALNSSGSEIFAAPGDTGGEAAPRVITAATSIQRGAISRYVPMSLGSGHHNNYDSAVLTALSALGNAPAGPKWVMLLSDGQTSVADSTLDTLRASGVHLSSFAVGTDANCAKHGALAKMSAATDEHCVTAATPANLAAQLTNAQPDGIANVTVSIGNTSVAADIDPVGGWSAKFTLGAGSYTATATAEFTSGQTTSHNRTFSVRASSAPGGPKPGTVTQGPGAKLATAIRVDRPKPYRTVLPSHVTGTVGLPAHQALVASKRLNGATVLLQGRSSVGDTWTTLSRARVAAGSYSLHWKPLRRVHLLRVLLPAHGDLAASSRAVPQAHISACVVKRHAASWSMTCHTTAKNGSKVRLYQGKHLVDRATAAAGLVKVHASGRAGGHVLVVKLSRKQHAHRAHLAL
jgi:hypothetical protein